MTGKRTDHSAGVFTLDGVLSSEECQALIARAEATGFEIATISAWNGARVDLATRNNDRVIIDDVELARDIWARVSAHVPQALMGRQARGLNERFRFYRYTAGQRFHWHSDGPFARDNGDLSLLTFMIYLSDEYEGGATRFETCAVRGRMGLALVFDHGLIHEGASVTRGIKFVLRSDVMYGQVGRIAG